MEKVRTVAMVPAAGHGKRLGLKVKKPFVLLGGKPLVTYAISALDSCGMIDAVVLAVERGCLRRFVDLVKEYKFKKIVDIVIGGRTRYESVRNCLKNVGSGFDIVVIHDGARPFLERSTIEDSIRLASRYGGCVTAVPESDTVKSVNGDLFIKKTLDRTKLYRAQTPQAFRYDLIKKAYESNGDKVTDDSSLVEALGNNKVKILKGSYRNIKITTKEDLKIAEVLLCG